jgi:hypothetical protein
MEVLGLTAAQILAVAVVVQVDIRKTMAQVVQV